MKELIDDLFSGKNVVFITGAGISTASGIPDFRSEDGLYNKPNKKFYEKHSEVEGFRMEFINIFIRADDTDKHLYILNNQPTYYDCYCYGKRYDVDLPTAFEEIKNELDKRKNASKNDDGEKVLKKVK